MDKKVLFGWIGILLLAFLLRAYGLGLNPVGISHDDELNELLNAKSVALTGEPRPGFVAGILTTNDECLFVGDCVYGELGTYVQVLWMRTFPLSLVWSRIFFVIASVGLVYVTGKLFENFSKSKAVGIATGFFVAINPWAIYYGRTAHTILFSHLFYILAAYFFTRDKSYKSNLLLGGVASGLASLFYFGAKPILPLILIWGAGYNLIGYKKQQIKFTLLWAGVMAMIIGGYFLLLANSPAGKRFADTSSGVPEKARVAIELGGSTAWTIGRQVDKISPRIESYLGFFSPSSLFLTGQRATDNYYLSGHGYFYLIDLTFLVFGLMAMAAMFKSGVFALGLIAIAVAPVAIKISATSAYSHRASLAYPLLCGVIGWGLYYFWKKISAHKKIVVSRFFWVLIITTYSLSLGYFLFVYWYRSPVAQSSRWFFHERVLASYVTRVQENSDKKIIVISGRPDGIFNSYVFYSGNYNNRDNIKEINNGYADRNYEFNRAVFTDDCNRISEQDLVESIILVDQINYPKCGIDLSNIPRISNPRDNGVIYYILNESLCSNYQIGRYPLPRSIYDFNVETQPDEVFCKTWITNPDGD